MTLCAQRNMHQRKHPVGSGQSSSVPSVFPGKQTPAEQSAFSIHIVRRSEEQELFLLAESIYIIYVLL